MKIESYQTVLKELRGLTDFAEAGSEVRTIFVRLVAGVARQAHESRKHEFKSTMKRFKSFQSRLKKSKSVKGKAKILKQFKFPNPITTATAMLPPAANTATKILTAT